MFFKQYYLGCLSHASYMIGDETSGDAVVVDPQRDIDGYLADAKEKGLTIRHVVLTHFHADFVAGHLELHREVGATIYLGAKASAGYAFRPLAEGQEIALGAVRIRVLETPGHTPEGISLLVFDSAKSADEPYAVLTGDTLFIGDVGRPDLLASSGITKEELGNLLYDSLRNKLMTLPPQTLVYPAHGAGSMCGKNLSNETFSTLGEQLHSNYALQPMSREEFLSVVTEDQPLAPKYFIEAVAYNKQDRPTLKTALGSVPQLDMHEVNSRLNAGAQLIDTRTSDDFAAGHLRGSINIGLEGKYATWVGTVVDRSQPTILLAYTGKEAESVLRIGRIGYDHVVGIVDGGLEAARSFDPAAIQTAPRLSAVQAIARASSPEVFFLDCRTCAEYDAGHVEGAVNIPVQVLAERLGEVPQDREVIINCKSGYRSSLAASMLRNVGHHKVCDVRGGYDAIAAQFSVA